MGKFNLFVGKPKQLPENIKYYYYSASSEYILLYTDQSSVDGFLLVDEERVNLSFDEREWLFSCKTEENKKAIEKSKSDYIALLETYASYLEGELKNIKAGEKKHES